MVWMLSFSAACSMSSLIASFMLVPVFTSMKFVVIIDPISSSSKDARRAMSFLASSSINSMSVVLSPLGRDFKYSVALSVSRSLRTAIFFLTLISLR